MLDDLACLENPNWGNPIGKFGTDQRTDIVIIVPGRIRKILEYQFFFVGPLKRVEPLATLEIISSISENSEWYLAPNLLVPDVVGDLDGFGK